MAPTTISTGSMCQSSPKHISHNLFEATHGLPIHDIRTGSHNNALFSSFFLFHFLQLYLHHHFAVLYPRSYDHYHTLHLFIGIFLGDFF